MLPRARISKCPNNRRVRIAYFTNTKIICVWYFDANIPCTFIIIICIIDEATIIWVT